jgi:hypothetical protein
MQVAPILGDPSETQNTFRASAPFAKTTVVAAPIASAPPTLKIKRAS